MPLTVFNQFHHLNGSAPDTVPAELDLNPEALRIDIKIFDNAVYLATTWDLTHYNSQVEYQAGTIASLDLRVRKIRIVNKVAASIGRYDIIAYYDPVEIAGRQYQRQP